MANSILIIAEGVVGGLQTVEIYNISVTTTTSINTQVDRTMMMWPVDIMNNRSTVPLVAVGSRYLEPLICLSDS